VGERTRAQAGAGESEGKIESRREKMRERWRELIDTSFM
jgi:hypothetical protein